MQFRTRAIHDGNEIDPQTGAVVRPIHLATTFVQPTAGEWGEFDYSRSGNPTRKAFESTLAALEGGSGALAFASGMAATHCAMMLLGSGDHVLAGTDIYGGTYRLLHKVLDRGDVSVSLTPTSGDLKAVEAAFTPKTKMLWIESPGNPLLSITDIAACAELAHARGTLLGVDNTFATPALTRPLELGADIVMHSATKYIGGHTDVLGGALVVKDRALFERLYFIQNATGAVMAPLESYLSSRAEDLGTACARAIAYCRLDRRLVGKRASRCEGLLPRPARASGPRCRPPANGRGVWSHAELRGQRRVRGCQTTGRIDAVVSAGSQPGSHRVAHRAAGRDVAC